MEMTTIIPIYKNFIFGFLAFTGIVVFVNDSPQVTQNWAWFGFSFPHRLQKGIIILDMFKNLANI